MKKDENFIFLEYFKILNLCHELSLSLKLSNTRNDLIFEEI